MKHVHYTRYGRRAAVLKTYHGLHARHIRTMTRSARYRVLSQAVASLSLSLFLGLALLLPVHLINGLSLPDQTPSALLPTATFAPKSSGAIAITKSSAIEPGITVHPIVRTSDSSVATTTTIDSTAQSPAPDTSAFSLSPTWSQDFSTLPNGPLSSQLWSYDIGNGGPDVPGWGNNEVEYYTNTTSNVRVDNGNLIIEAQQQADHGFDYTSARIKTLPSLNITYGKLDIVAKLPAGVGTWPAFWLLPTAGIYEPTTPAAEQDPNNYLHDGEIDMLEATGSIPGQITSSAQSYVYNPSNNNERIAATNVDNDTTTFHDYELQWTPTSLSFLVDGVAYHTVTKAATDTTDIWPYNQPYYLILNIAMGGTEGGTETATYPPYGIDNSSGPWEMAIRSITYYAYTGT